MKLSIAWIFDHLDAKWKDYDIAQLVAQFNTTTAEIEHFEHTALDLASLSLGQAFTVAEDTITVRSREWQQDFTFPHRTAQEGDVFLITKHGWATMRDLQGEKEGLVPALFILDHDLAGAWKEKMETEDYILEVDNKSITHRPDMWSHRGFAREIAAMLDVPLKPLDQLIEQHTVKHYEKDAPALPTEPFAITVENQEKIKHFSGLYVEHVESVPFQLAPSLLWMAHRLVKIDSKPIGALVDCTNYVMNDIGQPMHAFDAARIPSKKIEPRLARKGEGIELLDGQNIELEPTDIVITDGHKPIALAGIMGGKDSAINENTESLFLEAACFDAATIRRTSSRLRVRTDASARFEKSLDPHLNDIAIQRFLKLIHDTPLTTKIRSHIASVGHLEPAPVVDVSHHFIEARLGEAVTPDTIVNILEKLECKVKQYEKNNEILFTVTIPTFRATKDVALKEDIVEEVGRFVGYDTIPLVLPAMSMRPKDLTATGAIRTIKHHCASALALHEVQNYAFFDEDFLSRLSWRSDAVAGIQNPVSENWKSLVSSLIPHLLKNVQQNEANNDVLRFFECGRTWNTEGSTVQEHKSVGGIMFDRKKAIDFYDAKHDLTTLFEALDLDVQWAKPREQQVWGATHKTVGNLPEWYDKNKTAVVLHEGYAIGYAGKADRDMIARVVDGDAFLFELNGDFLMEYHAPVKKFKPLSKYPTVWLDVSMLVPLRVTVAELTNCIQEVDTHITRVELVDFFERDEWKDRRSLTFRYYVQNPERTLEKDDIDTVARNVEQAAQSLGVTIR